MTKINSQNTFDQNFKLENFSFPYLTRKEISTKKVKLWRCYWCRKKFFLGGKVCPVWVERAFVLYLLNSLGHCKNRDQDFSISPTKLLTKKNRADTNSHSFTIPKLYENKLFRRLHYSLWLVQTEIKLCKNSPHLLNCEHNLVCFM